MTDQSELHVPPLPVPPLDAETVDALGTTEAGDVTSSEAPEALGEASSEPAPEETPAEAPVRPREVIKGIHPELLCTCDMCAPEFTELQWFSPEEQRKTKGQVMLFCARSGLKYFSQAVELNAWLAANPVAKTSRRSKEAS